ncbi:MAG: hypothetical protein AAF327_21225, partial [Cyanobacteria bacterium P01_A01_bin.37]
MPVSGGFCNQGIVALLHDRLDVRVRDSTVTAPKTQIQALIIKIDEVLQSTTPSSEPQTLDDVHQQQVLEQARNYLSSLQGKGIETPLEEPQSTGKAPSLPAIHDASSLVAAQSGAGLASVPNAGYAAPAESAQQVLQAVVQEMNYLRVNMMQPLREELMTLYQQRQLLTADIQRLEQQRHDLLLSNQQFNQQQMMSDFMQSLTERLQDQLAAQIAQTYSNLELQASQAPPLSLEGTPDQSQMSPGQRLLHMQRLQAQSDDMMLKLDATLRVVFDSLQTNVDGYHESLIHGLEKMHGLGQQGEAMFAALVNRFAEQLGRGASYYLQSSMNKEWDLPGLGSIDGPDGALMPREPVQNTDQMAVPDRMPEEQLERIINTLDDAMQADSETSNRATDASSELDDGLIDELLGTLGAGDTEDLGDVDFDLDDVELAMGEVSLDDAILESADSGDDSHADDVGSSVSQDALTLFEIEEDGVRVHLDGDRLNQLQEAETDSFLNDLDAFTHSHATSSNDQQHEQLDQDAVAHTDMDDIGASDRSAAHEDDEALAFLDQIATEMEDDLSFIEGEPETPADVIDNDVIEQPLEQSDSELDPLRNEASQNDDVEDAQTQNALLSVDDLSSDTNTHSDAPSIENMIDAAPELDPQESPDRVSTNEMDAFFSMFETGTPDASSSDESLPLDSTNHQPIVASSSELEIREDTSPEDASPSEDESLEEASNLLSGLFGDLEDEADDPLMGLDAEAVESSADDDEDLFSDLGITTQDNPTIQDNTASEQIETITSLSELIEDEESRASIETANDLGILEASDN